MRFLLLIALAVSAFGQDVVPTRRLNFQTLVSSQPTPGTLGARYWWVASDNSLNASVTNWVDRVQGLALTNQTVSLSPTNSSGGVGFTGTTWLTNGAGGSTFIGSQGASSLTGSVWIAFSPQTPPNAYGAVMQGVDGHGLYVFNNSTLQFFGGSGSGTISAFTPGNTYDLTIVKTNANADLLFYTNGIARIAFAAGDFASGGFSQLGADAGDAPGNNYKGKIYEIAFFYSNITASTVTTLHKYATNTYGFSP